MENFKTVLKTAAVFIGVFFTILAVIVSIAFAIMYLNYEKTDDTGNVEKVYNLRANTSTSDLYKVDVNYSVHYKWNKTNHLTYLSENINRDYIFENIEHYIKPLTFGVAHNIMGQYDIASIDTMKNYTLKNRLENDIKTALLKKAPYLEIEVTNVLITYKSIK